jgi:hypothetical protein
LKIGDSKTLDDALSVFADFLVKGKIVETCSSTVRIGEDKYVFKVKGCLWAKQVYAEQTLGMLIVLVLSWQWLCTRSSKDK